MSKAGRQGNERPDHRQHAAEEHGLKTIFIEPMLGNIYMRFLNEEIMSIFIHEGTTTIMSNHIGKN